MENYNNIDRTLNERYDRITGVLSGIATRINDYITRSSIFQDPTHADSQNVINLATMHNLQVRELNNLSDVLPSNVNPGQDLNVISENANYKLDLVDRIRMTLTRLSAILYRDRDADYNPGIIHQERLTLNDVRDDVNTLRDHIDEHIRERQHDGNLAQDVNMQGDNNTYRQNDVDANSHPFYRDTITQTGTSLSGTGIITTYRNTFFRAWHGPHGPEGPRPPMNIQWPNTADNNSSDNGGSEGGD